jgi:hypothetical protein
VTEATAISRVTIVARNEVTLDELARYLDETGMGADVLRDADPDRVGAASSAVVLFPDDFEPAIAGGFVAELRRARAGMLIVLVTREPQRFSAVVGPDGRSVPPVVLPKTSFGWSIVDAIRAHRFSEE